MNDTGYVRMSGEKQKTSNGLGLGLKTEDEKLQLHRRGKSGSFR